MCTFLFVLRTTGEQQDIGLHSLSCHSCWVLRRPQQQSQSFWMTIFKRQKLCLPGEVIVTQKPRIPALKCKQFHRWNLIFSVQIPTKWNVSMLANSLSVAHFWLWVKKGGGWWVKHEDYKASWSTFWDIEKSEQITRCIKAKPSMASPGVQRKHTVPLSFCELLEADPFKILQSCQLVAPMSNSLHPLWSDMGLHALL